MGSQLGLVATAPNSQVKLDLAGGNCDRTGAFVCFSTACHHDQLRLQHVQDNLLQLSIARHVDQVVEREERGCCVKRIRTV
eukprot:6433683-Prymnesium_polylepis.1